MVRVEEKNHHETVQVKTPSVRLEKGRVVKKQKTSDGLACPKCGKTNACKSQLDGEFKCWCQSIKLSDDDRAEIKALGFSAECLCLQCLDLLRKEAS